MKIYISGPISGKDPTEANKAFKEAEKIILEHGHVPVNPYDMEKEMEATDKPWVEFMKDDIPMLIYCEAILLLPGWIYSAGCNLEYDIARQMHILLYDDPRRIPYTTLRKRERKAYSQNKNK